MTHIKGMTVVLIDRRETGIDPFGAPIQSGVEVNVPDVLVAPISTEDAAKILDLSGRHATYWLGIPKGDNHTWENREVRFFGKRWRTIGIPIEGITEMIPLKWNKKVMVERYE